MTSFMEFMLNFLQLCNLLHFLFQFDESTMLETLRQHAEEGNKQVFESSKLNKVRTFLLSRIYGNNNTIMKTEKEMGCESIDLSESSNIELRQEAHLESNIASALRLKSSPVMSENGNSDHDVSLVEDLKINSSGYNEVHDLNGRDLDGGHVVEIAPISPPESPQSSPDGMSPDGAIRKVNLHRSLHRTVEGAQSHNGLSGSPVHFPVPEKSLKPVTLVDQILKPVNHSLSPIAIDTKSIEISSDIFKVS